MKKICKENKSVSITVRIEPMMAETVEKLAEENKISVADVIRSIIVADKDYIRIFKMIKKNTDI